MWGLCGWQRGLQNDQWLFNQLNRFQIEASCPYLRANSEAHSSRSSFRGYLAEYGQYLAVVSVMSPSCVQEG
jgi:hypothetical protein